MKSRPRGKDTSKIGVEDATTDDRASKPEQQRHLSQCIILVPYCLEQKLQRELDQSRIRSSRRACYYPEIFVVRGATRRVGRGELCSVEEIEEFCTKLQCEITVAAKRGLLK